MDYPETLATLGIQAIGRKKNHNTTQKTRKMNNTKTRGEPRCSWRV